MTIKNVYLIVCYPSPESSSYQVLEVHRNFDEAKRVLEVFKRTSPSCRFAIKIDVFSS